MTTLIVPAPDAVPFPSLGGQVCDWIEQNLVFGPGDLRGEPARLDAEKRAVIWKIYEVYPEDHPNAGRRRFKRVGISWRKGTAKTEFAAWIVGCELHPEGPVRCIGWEHGQPIGSGVTDPYIPMVAYTEDQTEELAYGALKAILENSRVAKDFDIGLARIVRIHGDGKAEALSSSPNANDGARTTFQHFDETHRFVLERLKRAHQTMQANIPKRRIADAWSLETTTAFSPGEGSIAEKAMDYARQIANGKRNDSNFFFFHRQAGDQIQILKKDGSLDIAAVRAAVIDASGPTAQWSDVDGIVDQFNDPTADLSYLQRVWLNRPLQSANKAFDYTKWCKLAKPEYTVPDGSLITLGFDGSDRSSTPGRLADSTALIGTEIETGFQWVAGLWEHPVNMPVWEAPRADVSAAIVEAFRRWDVWRMYADPSWWPVELAALEGQYGDRVQKIPANRRQQMHYILANFKNAIDLGEISHDGNKHFAAHVGNAYRGEIPLRDEKGERLWLIYKERPDSPFKIDCDVAAALSWEARRAAIAAGVNLHSKSVYQERYERGERVMPRWWAADEEEAEADAEAILTH